jgi:hypothetical protein
VNSVVDRHRLGADPDPTFHFDADLDLDPKQTQPDPTLHMLENQIKKKILLFTEVPALAKTI